MKLAVLLSLMASVASAATIPIVFAGATETQIIIRYTAPSSSSCTITATDQNNGPTVWDVDASIFTNANVDLGRTLANGFAWPTMIAPDGLTRTVFIGTHDAIKLGLDSNYYSPALQVASAVSIGLVCGSSTGSITVTTPNLPVASYFPEIVNPTPGSPLGGMPQPTLNYSVPNYKTNDAITGVMMQTLSQTTGANIGSNGSKWISARAPVTDIGIGCDGTVYNPPISGYLLGLQGGGASTGEVDIYLLQSNGQACLQSQGYSQGPLVGGVYGVGTYHLAAESGGEISPVANNAFVSPAFGGYVVKITHVANNYLAYPPNASKGVHDGPDRMTYTSLGTAASIATQIASSCSLHGLNCPVANALATGIWIPMYFDFIVDNGTGDAIIQYRTQMQQDGECMLAWADGLTNTLIGTLPLYGGYPFAYGACHFSPQGAGGYSQISAYADGGQTSPIYFDNTKPLGGPFTANVGGMDKNGTIVSNSIVISSCTPGTTTVCTSSSHDIDQVSNGTNSSRGVYAVISGAPWTSGPGGNLNGVKYLHYTSPSTFTVYNDPIGATPYNSTGLTWSGTANAAMAPPLYSIQINSVSSVTGNARVNLASGGSLSLSFSAGEFPVQDHDPVVFAENQQIGSGTGDTAQYYAGASSAFCSGCSAGQVDIYYDSACTSHVPWATIAPYAAYPVNGYMAYAEACPSQTGLTLPGYSGQFATWAQAMYMDTTAWTSTGTPKIRCVTLQLLSDMMSDYPATGEVTAYPPPGDTTRPASSELHPIHVGDGIQTLRSWPQGGNWEILYVLEVNRISDNQINVVVERNYGDAPGMGWNGTANDNYGSQFSWGWTAWGVSAIPGGLVNVNSAPNLTYGIPPLNLNHNEFVPGCSGGVCPAGNLSRFSSYLPSVDSQINVSLATYTAPGSSLHSSKPFWIGNGIQGTTNAQALTMTSEYQSYPSGRWDIFAPPWEQVWGFDWAAMNPPSGTSPGVLGTFGSSLPIGGAWNGTYGLVAGYTHVYKLPVSTSPVNEKIAPLQVSAAPQLSFVDMSAPASLITDSTTGYRCTAYLAGECQPGSSPGDTFISGTGFSLAYNTCVTNTNSTGVPCAFGLWPAAGWALQVRMLPMDRNNTGVRRITQGFWQPPLHFVYTNIVSTPDAKWGIFAPNPVSGSQQWMGAHLPPWPTLQDNLNRTTFVPVPLRFPALAGSSVRVAFGYAENGNPASLYCTTRQETCWTSATATAANPFVFGTTDAQSKTSCSSGCTVNIPAIAGRILFYLVEYSNSAGILTGPLQALALP